MSKLSTAFLFAFMTFTGQARAQFSVPLRVMDEGTFVTPTRYRLNCVGGGISCADNAANLATSITIAAGAGGTLQTAYDNSAGATPSILLTAANNEIQIRAPAAAMGTIFDLQTNAGGGILRITDDGTSSFVSIGALTLTGAAASTWSTSAGALTVDAAAALNLGTTNATSLAVGRSGITTTVTGGLTQLTGAVSLTGNAAYSFTTSAGALTLTGAAASTWSTSAGALTVDASTALNLGTPAGGATSIAIGKSGITTTVTGGLTQLTGAVSLTGNGASSFTTSAGALTLTGAAASTWSTSAGALTINGTSGVNLQAAAATLLDVGVTTASTITVAGTVAGSTNNQNYYNNESTGVRNTLANVNFVTSGTIRAQFGATALTPNTTNAYDFGSNGGAWRRAYVRGTGHGAGDYALSAGWGTTASVALVAAYTSADTHFRIRVTSAGTGQAANPTVTLTFVDGTFTTAPHANVNIEAVTGSGITLTTACTWTSTATTLVITVNATPVAGDTVDIAGFVIG